MNPRRLHAVLTGQDGPSVLVTDAAGAALAAATGRAVGATVVVLDPATDRSSLLAALATALALPAWWGRNWDALEECLGDLAEVPLVVVWPSGSRADPDVRATALEVWRAAARRRSTPTVLVVA